MAELTQKQTDAAVVMKRAVEDFSNNFLESSIITLRLEFPELEVLLYSIEMKDNYFYEEIFHCYISQLYKLSLIDLQAKHNGKYYDYFMSFRNVRYLPHLKTEKIKNLFEFLEHEFKTEQKIPIWSQ